MKTCYLTKKPEIPIRKETVSSMDGAVIVVGFTEKDAQQIHRVAIGQGKDMVVVRCSGRKCSREGVVWLFVCEEPAALLRQRV